MNKKQLNDLAAENRSASIQRNMEYLAAFRDANAAKIEARNAAYKAIVTANAEKIMAYRAATTKKFKSDQASYGAAMALIGCSPNTSSQ